MQLQQYIDEILLKLGDGVVKVELEDNDLIARHTLAAFREVQRYINVTKYATIQYAPCIDLSQVNVFAITQVMRPRSTSSNYDFPDAIYLANSNYPGGLNGLEDYRTFLRTRQLRNTITTDLAFIWDETTKRLYVNAVYPIPGSITIAYIPKYTDITEIDSPYWEDIILRLALALCKETLGRIRGKYTLSNALYNLDQDALLSEAQTELTQLRADLLANSDLVLPID